MPTATFYPNAYHSIDLLTPNDCIGDQFDCGVFYLGAPKNMLRRAFLSFDVFGPAAEGRPLTPADALTAADLLTASGSLLGTTGFACTLSRVDRAGYDPTRATWNTYNGTNAWASLGGDFNTPTLSLTSPTVPLAPFTVSNLLPFVTDAIALRGGLVRFAFYAVNEAPGTTALWACDDGSLPTRPRLRVTWEAADPTPIAPPLRGLGGLLPAPAANPSRPTPPSHPAPPSRLSARSSTAGVAGGHPRPTARAAMPPTAQPPAAPADTHGLRPGRPCRQLLYRRPRRRTLTAFGPGGDAADCSRPSALTAFGPGGDAADCSRPSALTPPPSSERNTP